MYETKEKLTIREYLDWENSTMICEFSKIWSKLDNCAMKRVLAKDTVSNDDTDNQ